MIGTDGAVIGRQLPAADVGYAELERRAAARRACAAVFCIAVSEDRKWREREWRREGERGGGKNGRRSDDKEKLELFKNVDPTTAISKASQYKFTLNPLGCAGPD